jgi:hypothetical protein
MNALLSWLSGSFSRRPALECKLPEPEPLRPKPRAMTGFLATLTEAQKEAALAYQGPDTHGEYSH